MLVTGVLEAEDGGTPLRVPFSYRYGLDEVDALLPWRARLLDLLEAKAEREIARGGSFATGHWDLDRDGLSWTARRERRHVPTAEIAAADGRRRAVRVAGGRTSGRHWSFPNGSPNAMVLWGLLAAPASRPTAPRGRRWPTGWAGCCASGVLQGQPSSVGRSVCSHPCFCSSESLVFISLFKPDRWMDTLAGSLMLMLVGGGPLFILWLDARNHVSIHSNGVCQRRRFGSKRILFADLITMKWAETRVYLHGVYSGTDVAARLKAIDGTAIRFRLSIHNVDFDLDRLRVMAATQVARRLRADLARGRRVRWVGRLSFTPDGLAVASRFALFGGRERVFWSWTIDWSLENGKLRLRSRGQQTTVGVDVSVENFQPGLVLLEVMGRTPDPVASPV